MYESATKYQSYLVRLWQDGPHTLWRATAHHVQSSEIVHFADLEALFTFLWAQTASQPISPLAEGTIGPTEEIPFSSD
jgi:hypothetical protein